MTQHNSFHNPRYYTNTAAIITVPTATWITPVRYAVQTAQQQKAEGRNKYKIETKPLRERSIFFVVVRRDFSLSSLIAHDGHPLVLPTSTDDVRAAASAVGAHNSQESGTREHVTQQKAHHTQRDR